jgi:hypothetical protein
MILTVFSLRCWEMHVRLILVQLASLVALSLRSFCCDIHVVHYMLATATAVSTCRTADFRPALSFMRDVPLDIAVAYLSGRCIWFMNCGYQYTELCSGQNAQLYLSARYCSADSVFASGRCSCMPHLRSGNSVFAGLCSAECRRHAIVVLF